MKTGSTIRSGVALSLIAVAVGCSGASETGETARLRSSDSDAGAESVGRVSQALTEVTDKFFADETGTIYATTTDGDLLWFKDLARNGTSSWHANSGNRIGTYWNNFKWVFSGGAKIIYAVHNDGTLYFYRDNANNGTWGWDAASGTVIGSGWQNFRFVFGDYQGTIYGVTTSGNMHRYVHTGRASGTYSWSASSGELINTYGDNYVESCWPSFFNNSLHVVGGANEDMYLLGYDGHLRFMVDDTHRSTGPDPWPDCTSQPAYTDFWSSYQKISNGGGTGTIYALGWDGALHWLRNTTERTASYDAYLHPTYNAPSWAAGSGNSIRSGFDSLHYP